MFNYEFSKIDNDSVNGYSGNLQLGYTPLDRFSIYGVGSALTQSTYDTTGYGFGYGVGSSVVLIDKVSLSFNHIIYDMTNKYEDYEYKTTSINLIYNF